MARFARVVVPGVPYHLTHRGNRREDVFYEERDREIYLLWLREYCEEYALEVWAWCLMSNHVHLLVVPRKEDSLAKAIGRYYSTPLDEEHLWAAVRYIEANPLRARMVRRAEDYAYSSARAHALGAPDPLLSPSRPFPDLERIGCSWSQWLLGLQSEETLTRLRISTSTGQPCGSASFVEKMETLLGRVLTPRKRGRKAKEDGGEQTSR